MTVRRIPLFYAFIPVILLFASAQLSSAQEIVLYASQAPVKAGNWSSVADSTAVGGARLYNPDAGAPKIVKAAANPSSYAELTFSALAGIPYRIWVRGKAQSNSPYNDSIFVQFSGSLDISGSAAYRIGTTSATEINLEDCLGCAISGWGWQDNGWGVGVLGPAIFFQSTGTQTVRIQTREDGFSIDQIVLSPSTYLYNPPGALKNDGVILPASSGPAPAPTPTPTPTPTPAPTSGTESPNNTRVPTATQIVDSNGGVWTLSNGAILRNGAGTGGAGSQILYCNRIVYVFGTDSQWWRWTGSGWTPVGTTDPCGGATPTATTESPNNTRVPPGTQIVDSNGGVWTLSNGAILRNGAGTGGGGSQILYCNRIVYVFGTDSQWWRWTGSGWTPVGTTDPCGGATPTATTESPNNTRVPPGTQIVDSNGGVWTLSNGAILRNGAGTGGAGSQILYCNRIVYVFGTDSQWWRWTGSGWTPVGTTDPCATPSTNQPPQVSISATPTSGTSPLFVSFSSASSDPDGYITSYSWTFGDGKTSMVPYPTNTYQSAGTYTARLTVTDNSGASSSATVQINVSSPITTSSTLKVLSWNVAFGKGTDNVLNWNRTATWIASMNPDLVALCEMPPGDISTLVSLLSQKTGRTWYSHFVDKYAGNWEGNLILSKHSFISTSGRYLSYNRSVAQATVSVGGRTINFFATHLDPDSSGIRYTQVGELMSWASGFGEQRIVAGDINAGPDTSESIRMTGGYYDTWMRAMNAGTAAAYPDNPVGMHTRTRRGRIDYVFYSHGAGNLYLQGTQIPDTRDLSNKNVVVSLGTLDDKGVRPSDHNPMVANFEIR